jgi:hypothetical protein
VSCACPACLPDCPPARCLLFNKPVAGTPFIPASTERMFACIPWHTASHLSTPSPASCFRHYTQAAGLAHTAGWSGSSCGAQLGTLRFLSTVQPLVYLLLCLSVDPRRYAEAPSFAWAAGLLVWSGVDVLGISASRNHGLHQMVAGGHGPK